MTPRPRALLFLGLVPLAAALGGEAEDAERAELAAKGMFKLELLKGEPIVLIHRRGDAAVGEVFEAKRGEQLVAYAQVSEISGGWPKVRLLLGSARRGDLLVRVSVPIMGAELLTDETDCREARELKALCGDKLTVVPIGDRMRKPFKEEALIVLYRAGAPFMMGDPIVEPHAAIGGVVIADMMAYCHLRGIPTDENVFKQPPSLRIIEVNKLTRGLAEESRVPWYGTKGKQYLTRLCPGTPPNERQKRLATDESTNHTTMILEEIGGGSMLALDLISLNGRGGIDPGSKNKWLFVARALGTGPLYSIYRPSRPDFDDLKAEFERVLENREGRVRKTVEGAASGEDNIVYSLDIGERGKPLVVLVGGLEGTDWIAAVSLLRLAEVLLDNELRDYKIDWLRERLHIKIIPCLNLPGYKANTAVNANGVDLNRNFPYHWEEFADKKARGREPFSEPETTTLQRIIEDEKPAGFLELDVDDYDGGYRIARARDASEAQRNLCGDVVTIANARLRRRYVLGEKPLLLRLTRDAERPSAINWAGSKGVLAASLKVCGDGEDSLINTDVAVEACLAFLQATALSLEKPSREPPTKAAPPRRSTPGRARD